jgi:processive 1,2-diacylglycerol beta-glucosyltransferase
MEARILILSAPFGAGHQSAALAIEEACRELRPACSTQVVRLERSFLALVARGYLKMVDRAPGTYRHLYHAPVGRRVRSLINALLLPAVTEAIARFRPTAVIATHPFPGGAAALLRRRGRLGAPLAMAVTDFIPHPLWVQDGVDRYFAASPETAARLEALGAPQSRVQVTGIPVRLAFSRPDLAVGARESGLPAQGGAPADCRPSEGARRVLVMGGGLGMGPVVEAVRSLATQPHPHLLTTVVAGKNPQLLGELIDLFGHDPRITILGYTDQIADLMKASDLLLTKPGGLTCSEALACGLPMLLLPALPGQEEENAAHLVKTGAAVSVAEEQAGWVAAELLFKRTERLMRMREAAARAGYPRAALQVAYTLMTAGNLNQTA